MNWAPKVGFSKGRGHAGKPLNNGNIKPSHVKSKKYSDNTGHLRQEHGRGAKGRWGRTAHCAGAAWREGKFSQAEEIVKWGSITFLDRIKMNYWKLQENQELESIRIVNVENIKNKILQKK